MSESKTTGLRGPAGPNGPGTDEMEEHRRYMIEGLKRVIDIHSVPTWWQCMISRIKDWRKDHE